MVTKKTPGTSDLDQADLFSGVDEINIVEIPKSTAKVASAGGPKDPHDPKVVELNEDDKDSLTLAVYAERAYLDYAISVVKGRALPDRSESTRLNSSHLKLSRMPSSA